MENTNNGIAILGASIFFSLFTIAILVLGIAMMWKIFKKAGRPGWAAVVPFYNTYILFEITWGKGILFLLMIIPLANMVISLITMVKLAKVFGKGIGFALLLIFLAPVGLCILAFGSAEYQGLDADGESASENMQAVENKKAKKAKAIGADIGSSQPESNEQLPENTEQKKAKKITKMPAAQAETVKATAPHKAMKAASPDDISDSSTEIDVQQVLADIVEELNEPESTYIAKVSGNKLMVTWNLKNTHAFTDKKIIEQARQYRYVVQIYPDGTYTTRSAMSSPEKKLVTITERNDIYQTPIQKAVNHCLKRQGLTRKKS